VAQAARTQSTRQLADLIDGLSSEQASGVAAPALTFQIVIQKVSAEDSAEAAPRHVSKRDSPGKNGHVARDRSLSAKPGAPTATRPTVSETAVLETGTSEHVKEVISERLVEDGGPSELERTFVDAADDAVAILLEEDTAAVARDQSAEAATTPPARDSAQGDSSPAAAAPVACPLCRHVAVPSEMLSGGRVRCANCNAAFMATAAVTSTKASPARARVRSRAVTKKNEESARRKKWQKPAVLAAASVAAIVLLLACFPRSLFGHSAHPPVFPAQGKITFEGEPLAHATICLHPVGIKDIHFPRPRAVSGADGSFVLGTYNADDGAPAGEFKVTVQCFKQLRKVENESEGAPLPKNVLPRRLANPETSRLIVHVQEGDNQIPTLVITQ
jgi:hypothetical protein